MLKNNNLLRFRKPRLSSVTALLFISLATLILFFSTTKAYSAEATLSWTANSESDLAGYYIHYGTSSGSYDTIINVVDETKTSEIITGLVEGDVYYFALTAYDNSSVRNESSYSEEVVYNVPIVDTTQTLSPQDTFININNDVKADSTTLNTYTWPDSTSANAILMKYDLSNITNGANIQEATLYLYLVGSDSLVESDSTSDSTYTITVHKIINNNPDVNLATGYTYDGTNSWSENTSANDTYNNIPLAQSDISAAYDTRDIDKTLEYKSWNITSMVQEWINTPSANFGLILNSDPTKPSGSYRYFASMENDNVNIRPYLSITLNTDASVLEVITKNAGTATITETVDINSPSTVDVNSLSTPTSLQATAVSSSQIDLSWNASTDDVGVTGYGIYRDGIQIVTTANTTYQDTGLSSSTAYTYIVSAYNAAGNESEQSSEASTTTLNEASTTLNNVPVLSITGSKFISEGKILGFTISATDPDGDTLSYTASNLPSGASFDENTAAFSWTPTYDQAATYSDIIFQVSDGKDNDSENITITVSNSNRAPVLDPIKYITVNEGSTITLNPTATDPDGDDLTFSYSGWMALSDYTTNSEDVGFHAVTVTVSDGLLSDSQVVKINIFATAMANIYWRHRTTGQVYIWRIRGTSKTSEWSPVTISDLNWQIKGVGDFDGNDDSDILWRHSITGQMYVALRNNTSTTFYEYESLATIPDLDWQIKGIGDFDGDGKSDILWRHSTTGQVFVVLMNGTSITSYELPATVSDLDWQIKEVGDFDGDGKSDILWRHSTTGQVFVVLMNGTSIASCESPATVSDLDWQIKKVGDFDGDGKSDILWHHSITGQVVVMLMNGTSMDSYESLETVSDLDWQVKVVKDFDGDGKSDILWHHRSTGQVVVVLMNGASVVSHGTLETVSDLNWQIQ